MLQEDMIEYDSANVYWKGHSEMVDAKKWPWLVVADFGMEPWTLLTAPQPQWIHRLKMEVVQLPGFQI